MPRRRIATHVLLRSMSVNSSVALKEYQSLSRPKGAVVRPMSAPCLAGVVLTSVSCTFTLCVPLPLQARGGGGGRGYWGPPRACSSGKVSTLSAWGGGVL